MKTKKQYKTENIVAAICAIIGTIIIIYCRIDGMNLTEGELFAVYWPGWLIAICCFAMTLTIITTPDINQPLPKTSKFDNIICGNCGHGRDLIDMSKWKGGPL